MEHLNHYGKKHEEKIVSRYLSLNIVYMVGSNDKKRSGNLLKNCKADMQGINRRQRSKNFVKYLNDTYNQKNKLIILPNVPHNYKKVFQSFILKKAFFTV